LERGFCFNRRWGATVARTTCMRHRIFGSGHKPIPMVCIFPPNWECSCAGGACSKSSPSDQSKADKRSATRRAGLESGGAASCAHGFFFGAKMKNNPVYTTPKTTHTEMSGISGSSALVAAMSVPITNRTRKIKVRIFCATLMLELHLNESVITVRYGFLYCKR